MLATVLRDSEHMPGGAQTGKSQRLKRPHPRCRVAITGKHTEFEFKVSATGFELAMRPMP
jgi:hypothetical protein